MDRPATWDSTKERRGLWVSIARKLVFHQLSQLHTGCIELREGDNVYHFGEVWVSGADLVAELHVKDPDCYLDILTGGSIGAAEAYMTGDWSTPDLTALVRVMVRNRDILDHMEGGLALLSRPFLTALSLLRRNTEKGARRNIAAHYDLGNDFFKRFLDPTMMYSSGIFPEKDASMEQASLHKLKTICERLQLKPGEHVIEIGTGWGGFALYAAKHYGVQVTTTTISQQQFNYAKAEIEAQGLQDQITLLSEDYRRLEGQYDKLVSIEMIEAVGAEFYPDFFATCSRLLRPGGLMVIQAITIEDQRFEQARRSVDFIKRYIFPGSCIPSTQSLCTAAMKASDMRLVAFTDFAEHYARTLNAWFQRFQLNRAEIESLGYSETFLKMWEFYLCYCEGGFAERSIGVAHFTFAKPLFR